MDLMAALVVFHIYIHVCPWCRAKGHTKSQRSCPYPNVHLFIAHKVTQPFVVLMCGHVQGLFTLSGSNRTQYVTDLRERCPIHDPWITETLYGPLQR